MPVFTMVGAALFGAGTFFAGATAFALQMAVGVGLNLVARALAGKPQQPGFSVQGKLQAGDNVPRSFLLGYAATAGSLVYGNTWGQDGNTPNAYLVQVIALSDYPIQSLHDVWVNGEKCTLETTAHAEYGRPVSQYRKNGKDHCWIKFYDGTQTSADGYLISKFAGSSERPYTSARVGKGVAYVVCTSLVNDKLWSGFPTFKFSCVGARLYDPSRDTSVGGSGPQRWNDPATWGGDGDHLPAVQLYNLLRGFSYGGQWLYGLQGVAETRLPAANWNAQIAKCRAEVEDTDGLEPIYRSGGEINVSVQIATGVEALLTACHGRVCEVGGVYKMYCGAPESAVASFTDADILSTEEQSFTPFFGLADSINGVSAKYPSPADNWNAKVAPPLYRSDIEARDGNRRLMADVSFDLVPYAAQVQRLMKSALEEGQRARRHTISLPPSYWVLEPGDIVAWTSVRNGYDSKLFRIDGMIDQPNLDVVIDITEVDPADFDWNYITEFVPPVSTPVAPVRPAPQPVIDWYAEPAAVTDDSGVQRRPAIMLHWHGDVDSVIGVQFEVRLLSSGDVVYRGRTDQLAAGSLLITQGLLPQTTYEVRGQYIPAWPREMLWSGWLSVTTPDVRMGIEEWNAAVAGRVTGEFGAIRERLSKLNEAVNRAQAELAATLVAVETDLRGQSWDHRIELKTELASVQGELSASISEVWTVATNTETALASTTSTLSAQIAGNTASIATTNAALATTNSTIASTTSTLSAQIAGNTSTISTHSTAIASINGALAASWGVTTNVNGYVTGIQLLNGGGGISAFTVTADTFKVAFPSHTGGDPQDVFAISNVSGSPKLTLRGDMIADGLIVSRALATGAVTTNTLAANSIVTEHLTVNSVTKTVWTPYTLPSIGGVKYHPASTNVVSCTMTTKSTTISLEWNVHLKGDFNGAPAGSIETRTFQIKVDGSVVDTKTFYATPAAGSPTYSGMNCQSTIKTVIYALTPGTHTFEIYNSGAAVNGFDGGMLISDLFR